MSADLELQVALRALLVAKFSLVALVPAAAILDTGARPFPSPCIILGESQEQDPSQDLRRKAWTVFHTLHVWKEEPGLAGIKAIIGEVLSALYLASPPMTGDYRCADLRVQSTRTMRDPDGKTAHGMVTVEARLWRVS